MKTNRLVFGIFIAAAIILAGCGAGGGSAPAAPAAEAPMAAPSTAYESEYYAYDESGELLEDAGFTVAGASSEAVQQKIILEANLNMATDRFDEVVWQIRDTASVVGGYIENSNQSTRNDGIRYLNITVRVPYESYESALSRLKDLCVLTEARENQRNATAEYYDIKARLETKLIEEERLLDLIDRTESVEDILKLEELLGQVRMQIEIYQSQLTGIDRLASYSTISIYLEEVADETAVILPTGLSGRMYESFVKSVNMTIRILQGVLIVLAGLSVPLCVILVALTIIWGLFRVRKAARKNRKE